MEFYLFARGKINSSGKPVAITITAENVIYIECGRVVTLNELKAFFSPGGIFIRKF